MVHQESLRNDDIIKYILYIKKLFSFEEKSEEEVQQDEGQMGLYVGGVFSKPCPRDSRPH